MSKVKLARTTAFLITLTFILVFAAIVASGIYLGMFLFSQAAFAADPQEQQVQICLSCHANKTLKASDPGKEISVYIDPVAYKASRHGSGPCTACHRGMEAFPHQDVVYGKALGFKVADQCANCHAQATGDYKMSVHGQLASGGGGATCSDCHGGPHAKLPASPAGAAAGKLGLVKTCTKCHEGQVAQSYASSFHGTAVKYGYDQAAGCIDCHGSHDTLPASDSKSRVAAVNLPSTCTGCHGGLPSANWAEGKEHVTPADKTEAFPLWIVWKIFLVLILFDVLYNGIIILLELSHQFRHQLKERRSRTTLHKDKGINM